MVNEIKRLCKNNSLRWTNHVFIRLAQRKIDTEDVVYALLHGEIIEQYPTDYPYPSCLVLGTSTNNHFLHIVFGIGAGELWLITAYHPDQRAVVCTEAFSVQIGKMRDFESVEPPGQTG